MNCCKFFIDDDGKCIVRSVAGDCEISSFHELKAEMKDGAGEKHLPVVKVENNIVTVEVGSIHHPMTAEHSIEWIYLVTETGEQLAYLNSDSEPIVRFALLSDDKPKCVYAYCNLHGLWKIEL